MNEVCEWSAYLQLFRTIALKGSKTRTIMKSILSGVLRRENGVVQRNGWAGVLPIEFIERSRNESLGIEWFFAAYSEEYRGRTGTLEGGVGLPR
jgi:hypothetical protein